MKRLLVSVFLAVLLSATANALTASIGNARMIIHTDVEQGTPTVIQKSIKINNVNNMSVEVTLMPSGDIKDFTQVLDNNIILSPGQSRDARFVMSLEYGGRYDGKILVNFKSAEEGVKSQPVGLASTVVIVADGPPNPNPQQPEDTVVPEEPEDPPVQQEEPESGETPEESTPVTPGDIATKPTEQKKSNPIVGAMIILVVLAMGAGAYWWLMRK